jgi:hypothetical protein
VVTLKGTLIGLNHNDVTGQPDCQTAVAPCVNGVYGYLAHDEYVSHNPDGLLRTS